MKRIPRRFIGSAAGPAGIPKVAMNGRGGTLATLLRTIHAHPTLSEAVKIAARDG